MSMYSMVFGQNPMSDVLLATLGLSTADVGRFRDCFIADGKIAVYTRNGGGNRGCWHRDRPEYGSEQCKHHALEKEEDEKIWVDRDDAENYPQKYSVFTGRKQMVATGKRVMKTYYFCEQPASQDCACPGCTIKHRLPEHPSYLYDEDDDFDCTYATIYFSFPKEHAGTLAKFDSGEKFDPDKRWLDFINSLSV